MAFIATNILPATQYDRAKKLATQMKNQANVRATAFASGANSAEILAALDAVRYFNPDSPASMLLAKLLLKFVLFLGRFRHDTGGNSERRRRLFAGAKT